MTIKDLNNFLAVVTSSLDKKCDKMIILYDNTSFFL